ncbi:hypothetical protein U9M48_009103 [Paspalum notatum var. saurae]|uniref:Uncharacterized protein n=1 Tax=Paspalum notatum var. saurae TaxID=547442 RepID=A0AAQ3SR27_PASNO
MWIDVENFVKQCTLCQQAKHEKIKLLGLLQPLPIPDGAWQHLTMDFIEDLPKSETFDTLLVIVDKFTKYAHFIPLHHPFTALQVAKVVLGNVVKLHAQNLIKTQANLALIYYDPFTVLEKIGAAAYRLVLPEGAQIHPVFHLSAELPKPIQQDAEESETERIMWRRLVKIGNSAIAQVLVKWTQLPEVAATWEDYNALRSRFPTARAWGQVPSQGG